jgi:hypothetical protein
MVEPAAAAPAAPAAPVAPAPEVKPSPGAAAPAAPAPVVQPPSILTDEPAKPSPEKPAAPAAEKTPAKDPAKPEGAKPDDKTPAKEPEKPAAEPVYQLKRGEKSLLNEDDEKAVLALAKEKKISPEHAQAILEHQDKAVATYMARQTKALQEKSTKDWPAALKADKDFGGDKFTETCELAHRAFSQFADEALIADLKATGLANHPGLVKTFARIGKRMQDARILVGKAAAPGKDGRASSVATNQRERNKELANNLYKNSPGVKQNE